MKKKQNAGLCLGQDSNTGSHGCRSGALPPGCGRGCDGKGIPLKMNKRATLTEFLTKKVQTSTLKQGWTSPAGEDQNWATGGVFGVQKWCCSVCGVPVRWCVHKKRREQ